MRIAAVIRSLRQGDLHAGDRPHLKCMSYMATIFVELREFDIARIAEADRELQSLMHREGFDKRGADFVGPTNRDALALQKHLNEVVLPQLRLVGSAYADITHHRKA